MVIKSLFNQKPASAGLSNEAYNQSGAQLLNTAEEVWDKAEMIIKVKEPLAPEFSLMKPGQIIFTYLHLAAEPELTSELLSVMSLVLVMKPLTCRWISSFIKTNE